MKKICEEISEAKKLIIKNEMADSFKVLIDSKVITKKYQNEIIGLNSWFNEVTGKERRGELDSDTISKEKNRISNLEYAIAKKLKLEFR